jgi:hypothetical protein
VEQCDKAALAHIVPGITSDIAYLLNKMEIWIPLIVAFIAATPGIFAAIAQLRRDKRETSKAEAETADIIQRSAGELVVRYRERIEELEAEVKELKDTVEKLQEQYDLERKERLRLESQIKLMSRKGQL